MKKRLLILALCFTMLSLFSACNNENNTGTSSAQNSSSSTSESTVNGQTGVVVYDLNNLPNGPNINAAPVQDLNDLRAVNEAYVWPLTVNSTTWFNSWASPSEIPADTLIYIFSYNRFVEFSWDAPFVPADQVEAAIMKHFDVTAEYLRTAGSYNAQNNTYQMPEGGGGWAAVAMEAKQVGNDIIIRVGNLPSDSTTVNPMGTLTLQLDENNAVKYQSFVLYTNTAEGVGQ